ncbi:MAG: hypothetical protein JXA96_05955 [Sedimentisphaerales bacterium]|nr:hypothetical protein [Sedimentisphaerales bacterium]
MKVHLPTRTFPVIFIFLFSVTIGMYQSVSVASEPNDTTIETGQKDSKTISDFNLPLQKHSLEIGSEIYHFNYKEPGGISDKGMFYGGILNYTYRGWVPDSPTSPLPDGGSSLRAEFRFATGDADYDGSLSDGTPYTVDNIGYNTYETRFLCGMDFVDEDWLASLSAGIGYRYSNDDSSFDPYGYERESNYLYLPVSYQLDGKYENNWAWGFETELDFLIQGLQKSYLSDVGDVDIENKQNDGFGLRASFRLQKKTNTGVLIIEPFVRYWSIEDSEYEYVEPYYYWEPKNSTTEIGLQLQWKF